MLNKELQVPFLPCLWYDAVLDWGLNPGPPALEANTLPLGYRGGSVINVKANSFKYFCRKSINLEQKGSFKLNFLAIEINNSTHFYSVFFFRREETPQLKRHHVGEHTSDFISNLLQQQQQQNEEEQLKTSSRENENS